MRGPSKLLPVATVVDVKNTIDAFAADLEASKRASRERAVEIARAISAGGKEDVGEAVALVGLETVKSLAAALAARAVLEPIRGREAALETQRHQAEFRAVEADRARGLLERVARERWVSLTRRSGDLTRAVRLAAEAGEGVSEIDGRVQAFVSSGTLPAPRLEATKSPQAATLLVQNLDDAAKDPGLPPSQGDALWRAFMNELNAALRRDPAPPSRNPGA